jgi:hypothetical protein
MEAEFVASGDRRVPIGAQKCSRSGIEINEDVVRKYVKK